MLVVLQKPDPNKWQINIFALGPYRLYAKSILKYIGPYRLHLESVVNYIGPDRLPGIVKHIGRSIQWILTVNSYSESSQWSIQWVHTVIHTVNSYSNDFLQWSIQWFYTMTHTVALGAVAFVCEKYCKIHRSLNPYSGLMGRIVWMRKVL